MIIKKAFPFTVLLIAILTMTSCTPCDTPSEYRALALAAYPGSEAVVTEIKHQFKCIVRLTNGEIRLLSNISYKDGEASIHEDIIIFEAPK